MVVSAAQILKKNSLPLILFFLLILILIDKYCRTSSNVMNQAPHLVMHSGRIGAVFDAAFTIGNMFMKLGALSGQSVWTARDVYDSATLPVAPS